MTKDSQPPTTAQGVTPAERDKLAELIFLVNTARMSRDEIGDPAEPNEQEYELADALLEAGYSRAPSSAPQEPVAWSVLDKNGKLMLVETLREICDMYAANSDVHPRGPFTVHGLYLAAPPVLPEAK